MVINDHPNTGSCKEVINGIPDFSSKKFSSQGVGMTCFFFLRIARSFWDTSYDDPVYPWLACMCALFTFFQILFVSYLLKPSNKSYTLPLYTTLLKWFNLFIVFTCNAWLKSAFSILLISFLKRSLLESDGTQTIQFFKLICLFFSAFSPFFFKTKKCKNGFTLP